jgi:glycosyltransferase involved in cell wall biosynthesis
MANLMDGLLELGVGISLVGAPGSRWEEADVEVVNAATKPEIVGWIARRRPALIHDFANFSGLQDYMPAGSAYCRTWQLTSRPPGTGNTVFASSAQMRAVGVTDAVAIPLPVNANRYHPVDCKSDYLLFLGRISAWKGAYEAAALAKFLGMPLVIAGPAWEADYLDRIVADFGRTVTLVGEVGGLERNRLLAEARALAVLSQPVPGPWGQIWCEPGAAVVSEAAASGTPVIATDNGCLPSLMPGVGVVVSTGARFTELDARAVASLPEPAEVRKTGVDRWGHVTVARQYLSVYERCAKGERWN